MEDLGAPSSYLTVEAGLPVFSCDGETMGSVEHLPADRETDIFDGLVIGEGLGPLEEKLRRAWELISGKGI